MIEGRLYTPTDYIPKDTLAPVVFLAGPIQGAEDWQGKAADYLLGKNNRILIANPRREYLPDTFNKKIQVDWEFDHLELARIMGVIMFWMGKEVRHDPKRAFAQTTRTEYGFNVGVSLYERVLMAVGIEEGYSGAWYAEYFLAKHRSDVIIKNNLIDTCDEVLRLVK